MKRWCSSLVQRPCCLLSAYALYCISFAKIIIRSQTLSARRQDQADCSAFLGSARLIIIVTYRIGMFKDDRPNSPDRAGNGQEQPRFQRNDTLHPTFRPSGRYSGDCSLFPDHVSMSSMKEQEEKEFSIRSIKTMKNPSRSPLRPNCPGEHEEPARRTPPCPQELTQYANIERILKSENENLKMQNELLLKEVHKLKQSSRKYKEEYRRVSVEVEGLKLECEAQRNRADEMKDIIMSRLAQLEGRVEGQDQSNCTISECESILEALTLSESGTK